MYLGSIRQFAWQYNKDARITVLYSVSSTHIVRKDLRANNYTTAWPEKKQERVGQKEYERKYMKMMDDEG
jgi:hypothetical protein